MMTSNAKELTVRKLRERNITLTVNPRRNRGSRRESLAAQKLAGAAVLLLALLSALLWDASAAFIMIPPALAAMLSKEKFLDFNIFGMPAKQHDGKLRSVSESCVN